MIVDHSGKKIEKPLDEMNRGELLEVNPNLLTKEEEEEWNKCYDEASPFPYVL